MPVDDGEIGSLDERTAQGVVELVVADLARAVAFYVALGFAEIRRTNGFAVLRFADAFLLIAEDVSAISMPRWVNLRIIVPCVEPLWAHANRLGLDVRHPLADRGYGLRDFTVRDPFGFEVRFAQVLS